VVPEVKPLSAYEVAAAVGDAINDELRYKLYPVIAEPPVAGATQLIVMLVVVIEPVDGADICDGTVYGATV
jgi:hypothetical protein